MPVCACYIRSMKKLIGLIIIVFLSMSVEAKHLYYEKDYQGVWCGQHNGQTEVKLFDYTRVDCVTDTETVEFDFAKKWAECTGQALYYSLITGKSPACVLIMENGEKDNIYLQRLQKLSDKYNFKIYTMTPSDMEQSQ